MRVGFRINFKVSTIQLGQVIPVVALYPGREQDEEEPELLDHMLNLARILSAPFPFVRVDMYATETEIRIGMK